MTNEEVYLADLAEEAAEMEAFARFRDEPFRPIADYDGKAWAVLTDGTKEISGCRHEGNWCSMFDGEYCSQEGFAPTQFKLIPDALLVAYFH